MHARKKWSQIAILAMTRITPLLCMRYVLFPELSTYPVLDLSVSAIQRDDAKTLLVAVAALINEGK